MNEIGFYLWRFSNKRTGDTYTAFNRHQYAACLRVLSSCAHVCPSKVLSFLSSRQFQVLDNKPSLQVWIDVYWMHSKLLCRRELSYSNPSWSYPALGHGKPCTACVGILNRPQTCLNCLLSCSAPNSPPEITAATYSNVCFAGRLSLDWLWFLTLVKKNASVRSETGHRQKE